jgi:hypothetical protein
MYDSGACEPVILSQLMLALRAVTAACWPLPVWRSIVPCLRLRLIAALQLTVLYHRCACASPPFLYISLVRAPWRQQSSPWRPCSSKTALTLLPEYITNSKCCYRRSAGSWPTSSRRKSLPRRAYQQTHRDFSATFIHSTGSFVDWRPRIESPEMRRHRAILAYPRSAPSVQRSAKWGPAPLVHNCELLVRPAAREYCG